ncbi:MAG: CpsD/CapB family tyrosine-protein kinase [Candidatus Thiodiazotropha sp.]
MEKIKKALERARDSRSTNSGLGRLEKDARINEAPVSETQITYTKTQSLNISKERLKEKRIVLGETNDSISDQYKVLRTHVLQRLKKNQWNTLVVTSPREGCGKTLTSINLATSIAMEVNHSALLVDMDLRRPNISRYFYDEDRPGISEYLSAELELSDILFNPGIERLVVLPGSNSFSNSSEMLSSPRMVKLINELKARYMNRVVILDMPPVLSCDDVIAFTPFVDAVMLVVEDGVTRKEDLVQAYNLIDSSKFMGVVLNKSNERSNHNGYY